MPDPNTSMKVEPWEITSAINLIKVYIGEMIESQKKLVAQNQLLVESWSGISSDVFLKAAISLEDKYDDLIDELYKELDYMERYKNSLLIEEDNLASATSVE